MNFFETPDLTITLQYVNKKCQGVKKEKTGTGDD
jgi:hypothetical protein